MRSNAARTGRRRSAAFATLALPALLLAGCGSLSDGAEERAVIPPAQAGPDADSGLGPGVRPLSFGPGDKSSPRVSPSGEEVAFVLDGHAAEKPLYEQDLHPLKTTGNLDAEGVEWLPEGDLAILGPKGEDAEGISRSPLFVARPDGPSAGDPAVRKVAASICAAGSAPGSRAIIAAVSASPGEPRGEPPADELLVLLRGQEGLAQVRLGRIEGRVTGLSVAPDGRGVALAVRTGSDDAGTPRFEVQVLRFSEDIARRVARVPQGAEVLGAPQWTREGIYFVSGGAGADRAGGPGAYALYRAAEDSDGSFEPVRGVGEGFVPSSISISPDGGRLAVVGRRNPGSPTNLYVLDLASGELEAATANENIEIKTNPRDLAWSPDGASVVLVARDAPPDPGSSSYATTAETTSSAPYNLYQVPVGSPDEGSKKEG